MAARDAAASCGGLFRAARHRRQLWRSPSRPREMQPVVVAQPFRAARSRRRASASAEASADRSARPTAVYNSSPMRNEMTRKEFLGLGLGLGVAGLAETGTGIAFDDTQAKTTASFPAGITAAVVDFIARARFDQ